MKVVLVAYAVLMLAYMTFKATGVGQPLRGIVKMILSTTFLGVGTYYVAINGWLLRDAVALMGLLLAWIGDLMLIFKHKLSYFHVGCTSFAFANAFLTVHAILKYQWQWWSILMFVAFYVTVIICQRKGFFSFGRSTLYLNCYSVTVGYNGLLGLAIAIATPTLPAILFGVGSLLFLASDVVLGLFMFKIKKWQMDCFNSLLYFSALMLIALSLSCS